jgi:hypothetical protein
MRGAVPGVVPQADDWQPVGLTAEIIKAQDKGTGLHSRATKSRGFSIRANGARTRQPRAAVLWSVKCFFMRVIHGSRSGSFVQQVEHP